MCYQILEVYASCKCLYYIHPVDKCAASGRPGHKVARRTIPVGYLCSTHSRPEPNKIAQDIEIIPLARAIDNNFNNNLAKILNPEGTLAEDTDYDDSIDNRSIVSDVSTATTADEDAFEALFHGLLTRKGLSNLWPQIVLGQPSRGHAKQTVERLLRRFAEDLELLAATSNDNEYPVVLSSSRYVKRHRAEIASRIYQAHESQHGLVDTERDTEQTGISAIGDTQDTNGSDPFMYSIAEEFIFGTRPIEYLQANVRAFVQQRQQKQFSRLAANIRSSASFASQFFCQTPVLAGKRRISWTCVRIFIPLSFAKQG